MRFGTKLALFTGFGGVLGLMALAGVDSIRALHQIQAQDASITRSYLERHHSLEQIRSSLYLSSTLVRDYVLEKDAEARLSLADLRRLRGDMNAALRAYASHMRPEERDLVLDLNQALSEYWATLAPMFSWVPGERKTYGLSFLETKILPRRTELLQIADKIAAVNDRTLTEGQRRSEQLFAQFRWRVMGILFLTLSLGLVVAGASIVHTLRLETERRQRYEEVQRAQGEMKRLSARLVEAQEEERRSISRELHDEIGQSLNALLLDLGNLSAIIRPENEEAHRLIGTARTLVDQSVKELRNMALLLRPSMLDDFGLVPALHWQAREVSRRTGMKVQVAAGEVADDLPDEYKTCIYRVVQEALQNASRHAEAGMVRIAVQQEPDQILLSIQDDGRGFDTEQVRGLGLVGMEERVKNLGGSFRLQSRPGAGVQIRVSLPLLAHHVHASIAAV